MLFKYLRIVAGLVICAYAVALFLVDLPSRINIIGPLFLIALGSFVIMDPSYRARMKAIQKDLYQSHLQADSTAMSADLRMKQINLIAQVLLLAALIWSAVGIFILGRNNWQLILGISA